MHGERLQDLEIRKVKINNINTIIANGKCDLWSVQLLKDSLTEVIDSGQKKIIVDIRNLRCVDNSGLAAILWARHKIEESHGRLIVVGLKENYWRRINSAGGLLSIVSSIKEAIVVLG